MSRNKLGQKEIWRRLSDRYNLYGRVKKIDIEKGLVYFYDIVFADEGVIDGFVVWPPVFPEKYIDYNSTIKKWI